MNLFLYIAVIDDRLVQIKHDVKPVFFAPADKFFYYRKNFLAVDAGLFFRNYLVKTETGQAISGYTNATHGMTLAAVSLPYYRYIMPYGLSKFKRFAVNVWGVNAEGKTDEQTASEGLKAMENWMKKLGLVLHTGEFGVTEADTEKIADLVLPMNGGYKALDREEIVKILKESI